jgi:hypothetical protein
MTNSDIARSYGSSVFTFLRELNEQYGLHEPLTSQVFRICVCTHFCGGKFVCVTFQVFLDMGQLDKKRLSA